MGRDRIGVVLVLLGLVLAGCPADEVAGPAPGAEEPTPPPSPTRTESAAPSRPGGSEPTERPASRPVVVTHHTADPLDLTEADAARLHAGDVRRWAGRRVVRALQRPARGLRAVRRDPGTLAVVPIDAVDPSVAVARVGGRDPLRAHPDAVTVTVVGDLMLTRRVPDPGAALAPTRDRLAAADLTVGNLESTLSTDGAPTQGSDSFGGSPALLGPLERSGFDALSLANNHAGDYGDRALVATVAAFDDSPVESFGAGRDLGRASAPAYLEAGGVTVAFLGFNAIGETPRATRGRPGALSVRMPPRTGPLVRADLDHVLDVVRRADRRADAVVVLPHWGTQYTHDPEPIQHRVAAELVGAGADLVAGGHPHWVQGAELVDGVPVVHSLGNFVFDMDFSSETMEGVVLEATFWGGSLKGLRFVPYRLEPGTFAPRWLDPTGGPGAGVLADLWSSGSGPFGAR